jgi:hypothetical protein
MFLYDFECDPQAQTGAGILLRGEKRFEDAGHGLGRDAMAGIGDADPNALMPSLPVS